MPKMIQDYANPSFFVKNSSPILLSVGYLSKIAETSFFDQSF